MGRGPRALLLGNFISVCNKLGKYLNENVSKFLQRVSELQCSHIILYHLTLN